LKRLTLLIVYLIIWSTAFCLAQSRPGEHGTPYYSFVPKPYVGVSLGLMPNGYASLAYQGEVGLDWEPRHFVGEFSGGYDNGRKTTNYTINNFRGHDRYLSGFAGYRFSNRLFIGSGLQWNQLMSSNSPPNQNYAKVDFFEKGMHADIGGGYDVITQGFSSRLQAAYVLPPIYECDAGSCATPATHRTQGVKLSVDLPSPIDGKRHWFWRSGITIFHYDNVGSGSGGGMNSKADFQLIYRF